MVDYFVKGKHGADSDWSQVEYNAGVVWIEERGKWVDSTFLVPGMGGLELEEMATMLAERVHRDNPQLASDAFESAKMQLLTRDFNGEWAELERKVKVHRMWGGPVPSAMLTPSADASEWEFMMVGKNGLPYRYKISQKLVGDDVPLPNTDNAIKHGESWYARPTPGQVQHSREQRRLAASRKRTLVRG